MTGTSELQQRWSGSLMNNYGVPKVALVAGNGAVLTDATAGSISICSAESRSTASVTAIRLSSRL